MLNMMLVPLRLVVFDLVHGSTVDKIATTDLKVRQQQGDGFPRFFLCVRKYLVGISGVREKNHVVPGGRPRDRQKETYMDRQHRSTHTKK